MLWRYYRRFSHIPTPQVTVTSKSFRCYGQVVPPLRVALDADCAMPLECGLYERELLSQKSWGGKGYIYVHDLDSVHAYCQPLSLGWKRMARTIAEAFPRASTRLCAI